MKNIIPFYSIVLLIAIILTGCSSDQPVQTEIIDLKPVLGLEETEVNMSEFIKDFEYFRPEAKPGSYFSLMGILYVGPEIVVLYEKRTQQASIFSSEELEVLFFREDITKKEKSYEMPYTLCFFRKIGKDLLFFRSTPKGDIVYEINNKQVNPLFHRVLGGDEVG